MWNDILKSMNYLVDVPFKGDRHCVINSWCEHAAVQVHFVVSSLSGKIEEWTHLTLIMFMDGLQ